MKTRRFHIVISSVALALLFIALAGFFDHIGQRYTDASFNRALVTFGVARGLNAVISVAQGTEVAMEPAGIGVIFAPGQILDPVNDMIERFSWIMLASATSLGIQGLLLKIFSATGFSLIVAVTVLSALVLLWRQGQIPSKLRQFIYRIALVLLILRFLIPVMAIVSEGFYAVFLAAEYRVSTNHLVETRDTLGQLNQGSRIIETQNLTWYESLSRDIQSTLDAMDIDKHVAALQLAVANLTEHTINLIVVFTVQTILFPLLFLWLVLQLIKAMFRLQLAA